MMRESANFKFRVVKVYVLLYESMEVKNQSFSFVVQELENKLFSTHIFYPLLINNSKLFAVTVNRKSH